MQFGSRAFFIQLFIILWVSTILCLSAYKPNDNVESISPILPQIIYKIKKVSVIRNSVLFDAETDILHGTDPRHQDKVKKLIIQHESFSKYPYKDRKGLTIGYGRNLRVRGLSESEAMYLLHNDLRATEKELKHNFPFYMQLNPARKAVVIDMAYNMGVTSFMGFVAFRKALESNNYSLAVKEMHKSDWSKQVKSRLKNLDKMMLTGKFV